MLLLFTFLLTWMPLPEGNSASPIATNMTNIARRHCRTQCGNLTVHYPFGIDKGCSMDESFELTCNSTYDPPKLFIGASNTEIYSTSDLEMRIYNPVSYKCYDASGNVTDEYNGWTYLEGTPFTFSQKNKFTVTGCDDYALILGTDGVEFTGCFGSCSNASDVHDGDCSGFGCCQTGIPKGLKSYNNTVLTLDRHTAVQSFNPCGFAFLGDEDSFQFGGARDLYNASEFYDRISASVPVVVDWVIGGNCTQATECKGNSVCNDTDISGYRCSCKEGYEGNPYLDPGCQDINECKDKSRYPCYGDCKNTQGGYVCSCSAGHRGDAKMADGCAPIAKYSKFPAMVFSLALVFGFMAILFGITGICLGIRKRKLIKLREKFFAQNGGVFLKQKLKAPGASDSVTIFSTQQLRVATDNYSEERIVGRGGHGVVYKGILPGERVVAIKKSKLVDRTQAEQFINEVLILTQVNHRNVVKLLGFCLEEENRLRVAAEAAAALAYLHSQATMPIIHRDVKSTNILLDENYTTKISDFGVSRLVPLDHDQVTTLVQGTIGYLDPQYFHTSQLTDKSDVYSFGVVLAELITGKKPLSPDRTNVEKNLATHFLKSMEENRFSQIIEPRLLHEATLENLQGVAGLARRCLNLIGENRPTMKEVAMELEGFRLFTTHPRVQQQTLESRSLILEVEQAYTGMSEMDFQEPR